MTGTRFTAVAAIALLAATPALAMSHEEGEKGAEGAHGKGMEEQKVTMDSVPHAAKAAAMYAAAGIELTEVGLDMDGGQATYEFSGEADNGQTFEFDVLPDGRVIEVEMEIDENEVPRKAMELVRQHLEDFQPTKIERSVRTGDVVSMWYEMEGTGRDGQEIDVEVLGDGKVILIQSDPAH